MIERDGFVGKLLEVRLDRRQVVELGVKGTAVAILNLACQRPTPTVEQRTAEFENVYLRYLNAFEAIAGGDQEAKSLLVFLEERRKQGFINPQTGSLVFVGGNRDNNFWTVIANEQSHPKVYNSINGAMELNSSLPLPVHLLIKDTKMSGVWAGAVMAFYGYQVRKALTKPTLQQDDFVTIKEAHELQIRLLNRATGGKFKEVLDQLASSVANYEYISLSHLANEQRAKLDQMFPGKLLSKDEEAIKSLVLRLALNYAAIDKKYANSPEEAKKRKIEFTKGIYQGQFRQLDPCSCDNVSSK